MINDIDELMQKYDLDGLLVTGPAQHNPAMVYMTGGAYLSEADLIKKRGEKAVLFGIGMEREEAIKTGLETRTYDKYPLRDLLVKCGNDLSKAIVLRYEMMLRDLGLESGKIALYGQIDLGIGYSLISALQCALPDIRFVDVRVNDILARAMMTKDVTEIARITSMGKITVEVVSHVENYLSSQRLVDGCLEDKSGNLVRIGDVKRMINLWLMELGAENPQGTIFAIGKETGIPHNKGTESEIIRTGQPIVFDIYPCERGGGYYFDFTRTWCLEYAPDEVQSLYEQVLSVYDQVLASLKPGEAFRKYQRMTCELFEKMGHPTVDSDPETESGYTHSLGHGVGLKVHERPFSGVKSTDEDILSPGSVFTVEPGLYYPEKGIGIRLENTYYVSPTKEILPIIEYPLRLVLPMKSNG